MAGMLPEEIVEDGAGLVGMAFDVVNERQVQIRLVESGREADGLFEGSDGLVASLRP